jgi:beta-glucuronidase
VEISRPKIWGIGDPHLYILKVSWDAPAGEKRVRFGIRTITIRGQQVFVNGRPVRLRGVNLHEEQMPFGRPYPRELRERDLRAMLSLGFNALRSAHYPHDEMLPELCDELGIVLLEEIPVYWDCDFANPRVFRLAARMLKELITRDFNHPSVIAWSCGNEIPVEQFACDQFIRREMAWVRRFDMSRIVFYVGMRFWCDTTRRHGDVCGVNEYFGWYYLTTRNLSGFLDVVRASRPTAPWFITEFGGDAKFGYRDSTSDPAKFSEDKQASIIADQIRTLNAKPYVAAWFIWIYRDFRSPLRTNQYQQGFNRKGLVSDANEQKLVARVMPRIINAVNPRVRVHFAAAVLIQKVAKYCEKALYLCVGPIVSWTQQRQSAKYYSGKIQGQFPSQDS